MRSALAISAAGHVALSVALLVEVPGWGDEPKPPEVIPVEVVRVDEKTAAPQTDPQAQPAESVGTPEGKPEAKPTRQAASASSDKQPTEPKKANAPQPEPEPAPQKAAAPAPEKAAAPAPKASESSAPGSGAPVPAGRPASKPKPAQAKAPPTETPEKAPKPTKQPPTETSAQPQGTARESQSQTAEPAASQPRPQPVARSTDQTEQVAERPKKPDPPKDQASQLDQMLQDVTGKANSQGKETALDAPAAQKTAKDEQAQQQAAKQKAAKPDKARKQEAARRSQLAPEKLRKQLAKGAPKQASRVDRLAHEMTVSERTALRQQISQCWNIPPSAREAQDLQVEIALRIRRDRTVASARILNRQRMRQDDFYRSVAESALRAVSHPRCTPLKLPPDKYEKWQKTVLVFDPSQMF